jgi:hypothetical protein
MTTADNPRARHTGNNGRSVGPVNQGFDTCQCHFATTLAVEGLHRERIRRKRQQLGCEEDKGIYLEAYTAALVQSCASVVQLQSKANAVVDNASGLQRWPPGQLDLAASQSLRRKPKTDRRPGNALLCHKVTGSRRSGDAVVQILSLNVSNVLGAGSERGEDDGEAVVNLSRPTSKAQP